MYEKCLNCNKIGISCDGPNFMAMGTSELIEWCNNRRKQLPGMTYDKIVELTGLSKGTVAGFFGGTHADYRIDTIRPILKLLVGGEWDDNPCADPTVSERASYEERIRQLEKEIEHRDDKLRELQQTKDSLQLLVANTNARTTADKDFLRSEMKRKNKTIAIMSTFLGICLLVIIGALVIDRINPEIGFFWLRSWLGGTGSGFSHKFIG